MRRFRFFWLCILWWGVPTLAQTPVPITASVEVTFPQSIYFEAGIAIPSEQVARVELILSVGSTPPVTISYPPQKFEFAKEFLIATYVWEFTPQTAPPLFSEVSYTWRVIQQNDQVLTQANTVVFTDQRRADWQTIRAPNQYEVTFPSELVRVNIPALQTQLADTYALLQRHTNAAPNFRWLVYAPPLALGCERNAANQPIVVSRGNLERTAQTIPCDPVLAEAIYAKSSYQLLTVTPDADLTRLLTLAMIETFYARLWQGANVPAWFQQGVQRLYLGGVGSTELGVSRQALRSAEPFTLLQMASPPTTAAQQVAWEAQSYGMVLMIAQQNSLQRVFDLVQASATAPDFATAYREVTGKNLNALIPDWRDWLFTTAAVEAYGLNVYQPPTFTPTVTLTPTLTRTPLPPTETPTITPDYSPTPRPTRTRIPPTPTLTPLPAQGFNLRPTAAPTPVPAPTSLISGVTDTQLVIFGVVAVVALFLLVLLFRTRDE